MFISSLRCLIYFMVRLPHVDLSLPSFILFIKSLTFEEVTALEEAFQKIYNNSKPQPIMNRLILHIKTHRSLLSLSCLQWHLLLVISSFAPLARCSSALVHLNKFIQPGGDCRRLAQKSTEASLMQQSSTSQTWTWQTALLVWQTPQSLKMRLLHRRRYQRTSALRSSLWPVNVATVP